MALTVKETGNQHYSQRKSEGINIKHLFSKLRRKWYVFLLTAILGVGTGLILNKFIPTNYLVSSTILYKSEGRNIHSLFDDIGFDKKNSNLKNQVGVLTSYTLNLKTLKNLNWDFSWYEKTPFGEVDLYMQEPFEVVQDDRSSQTRNLPITIKPVSEEFFMVQIDEELETGGVKKDIKVNDKVSFGQPYKNEYVNFTINKVSTSPLDTGNEYILVFNDLNKLALSFQKRLNIKLADEDSDIIYASLETTQPARAVSYLNELGEVYIHFGLNEKNKAANNTFTFIDNQIARVMETLQSAGKDFTNFRSRNRIVDLGQETELVVSKLEEIENEEVMSKMRLDYYNNIRTYLKDANLMEDLVAPSVVGITDPTINSLVLKLNDLYGQREVLSFTVQAKNPNLISLDKEIRYTQKILEENINNLLSNTKVELQSLNEQKAKVNHQLSRLPKTEQDLISIKRSFDLNNELYTFLLKKRAEAGIAKASHDPDAQILDPARIDTVAKIGPGKRQIVLVGLFAGLGLPFLFFILLEYYDKKLKNVEDVEGQLLTPVVGKISHNKFKSDLPVVHYPHSGITESFRALRNNIQYFISEENKKVIAVHSTVVNEGKSFVALNLSTVLSSNKKVLLVEADMRKPHLHKILKCSNKIGLSNYLSKTNTLEEVVLKSKIKGLHYVSAGSMSFYTSELLNSEMLKKFVEEAKEFFDYIVFDNPPAGVISDAMLVASHSDINLFVLRMKSSTSDHLNYINKLAKDGVIKKIAVVLNNVTQETEAFKNSDYGYYLDKPPIRKKPVMST